MTNLQSVEQDGILAVGSLDYR